ncbi:MAG UNVERIFIED_CONTAM: GtrA family protein [Microcystis novacekii LVE1205-3]
MAICPLAKISGRSVLKRFLKFNLICLAGLILNVLLLNFFFNVLHINRYLANLIAIAIVTVLELLDEFKTQLARDGG